MRDHYSHEPTDWDLERAGDKVQAAALSLSAAHAYQQAFPGHSDGVAEVELRQEIFDDTLADFAILYREVRLT